MIKKIFISTIPGSGSGSTVNKDFAEDLKYSMGLKFSKDQVVVSEQESDSDIKIFMIPEGKKTEKIQPDSNNF